MRQTAGNAVGGFGALKVLGFVLTLSAAGLLGFIIIPYTSCLLKGTERTRNVVIQRYNGGLGVTHQNIYNDPTAQKLTFDALANPGPANPQRAFD